jgi:hypothetical protein
MRLKSFRSNGLFMQTRQGPGMRSLIWLYSWPRLSWLSFLSVKGRIQIEGWYSSDSCTRRLFSLSIPTFGLLDFWSVKTSIPESIGSTYCLELKSGGTESKTVSLPAQTSLYIHYVGEDKVNAKLDPAQ